MLVGKYRNLALNTVLFALNSIATRLITFFLVPLYTSYMSAGEYGITDMSLTVISLAIPLLTLNISEAAVRHIVGDREGGGRYAAVAFAVTSGSVAFVALLSSVLDLGVFGGLGAYKGWFVLAYATSALMNLCGEIARGMGRVRLIPVCAGVSSVVTLVSALCLIGGMGMGVIGYFVSVSLGPAVAVAAYLSAGGIAALAVRGARELAAGGIDVLRQAVTPMVRYSLPLVPNSLFWWVGTSINRLIITGMLGISASGMFAAASKVPNLLNTAYSIFQQAWQLSAFQESGDEGLARFFSSVFKVVSAGMTVLCSLLAFLAPLLASVLLRGETYDAWPMIPVLLIANLLNVFNTFYGTVYSTTMHTAYVMRTTVFGALSCVVLTPLLVPVMGTYGACAASVVGQGLVLALRVRDSRRHIPFDAGWGSLLPTLGLLVVQCAMVAVGLPGWRAMSLLCFIVVLAIQGKRIAPIVSGLLPRLFRRDSSGEVAK